MDKVRIARHLVRLAEELVLKERSYRFSDKGTEFAKLVITLPSEDWKEIGKSPYWIEMVDLLNDDCKGNFYGIDHSLFKIRKDGHETGELTFNDVNDADHKSPRKLIERNLKEMDFVLA